MSGLTQRSTATGRNREREDLESRKEGCMTEIEVLDADTKKIKRRRRSTTNEEINQTETRYSAAESVPSCTSS